MVRRKVRWLVWSGVGVAVVIAVVVTLLVASARGSYRVTAVMPAGNPNLIVGSPIYIDGFRKGKIDDIQPQNNRAVVTVSLDSDVAPLHQGAFMDVKWEALVGERLLFIQDGPRNSPEVPDGARVAGKFPEPTEISDVLSALDPKTLQHLGPLVNRLQTTVGGHENDVRQTAQTAGPALQAVGNVLRGVGSDGPAINDLARNLNELMARVNSRNGDVRDVVQQLSQTTHDTAQQRQNLDAALKKLPNTLHDANSTLHDVPGVTDKASPLLDDLRGATNHLPSVSNNLAPLLTDLRPAVQQLNPTLRDASSLLNDTPGLLDTGHATVPGVNNVAHSYMPALEFLRPYTPEAAGFLTTWGSAGQNFDANGRYMRIFAQAGGTSVDANPGASVPGVTKNSRPAPGSNSELAGADGEGMH
jgi:phospholipid/cholesterol/gamma-HCH transport system substrate-binding protein